jgi:hypothetical protein
MVEQEIFLLRPQALRFLPVLPNNPVFDPGSFLKTTPDMRVKIFAH